VTIVWWIRPKDEDFIVNFINSTALNVKFIIAPAILKTNKFKTQKNSISRKTVLFSEKKIKNLADFDVFIIDTIGF
jgi:3-deoxy-D-manno-octulosonic-acid transferase